MITKNDSFADVILKILAALAGVAALVVCESIDTELDHEIGSLCDFQNKD